MRNAVVLPNSKCKLVLWCNRHFLCYSTCPIVIFWYVLCLEFVWWSRRLLTNGLGNSFTPDSLLGSMRIKDADGSFITGLHTTWSGGTLVLQPRIPDPWAVHCYDEFDNCPLKPWSAWGAAYAVPYMHQFVQFSPVSNQRILGGVSLSCASGS